MTFLTRGNRLNLFPGFLIKLLKKRLRKNQICWVESGNFPEDMLVLFYRNNFNDKKRKDLEREKVGK